MLEKSMGGELARAEAYAGADAMMIHRANGLNREYLYQLSPQKALM
jgi:hypothetical protein